MNKALKIGLIAIAVLVIGVVVWRTLIMPPSINEIKFDDSIFTTQIKTQSVDGIDKAKSFDKAQQNFTSMLQDINDAEFLENIDHNEATNCKKIIAQHFAPVLAAHSDSVFAANEWSTNHLDAMREAAQLIIGTNVLASNSDDLKKLKAIVKNVNDYHSALSFASSSFSNCTSQSEVNSVTSKARSYNRAPLNNCTSLVKALNAVPQKAKDALASYQSAQKAKAEKAERDKRDAEERRKKAEEDEFERILNGGDNQQHIRDTYHE
ncbi:MAG: hypothetical protein IJ925_07580 [Muribaculaceae bacterium]|nr:hypothetical protein [Muribaculaceae bacterium]